MKTTSTPPQLEPPGAGVPWLEQKILGWAVRLKSLQGREALTREFLAQRDRVLELARSCPAQNAGRPVLVARQSGMEDSSRYWSVWMTLDHLRIVNESIAEVITALGQNVVPPRPASTAAVKPSPQADETVLPGFQASCNHVVESEAALTNPQTVCRYAHPWFGPLDAHGWHAIATVHQGLHRKQLEQILTRLQQDR